MKKITAMLSSLSHQLHDNSYVLDKGLRDLEKKMKKKDNRNRSCEIRKKAEYRDILDLVAFWQKWWFYLLQITFILGVMLLTFVLSKRIRNDFVIRLMVYISLFLVFEYIHTEMEPYLDELSGETPIFKVVVNLVLALLLLPIELNLEARLKKRAKERAREIELSNQH